MRANRYDNLTINTRAGQSATLATRTLRLDRARSAITSEDNLSSSYRLAGLTEQKHLKRMSIGGAIRWEDEGAIGYHGIPIDGDITAATEFDPDRRSGIRRGRTSTPSSPTRPGCSPTRSGRASRSTAATSRKAAASRESAPTRMAGRTYRIINPGTFICSASFDL